jgi:hypothetical protein
MGSRGPIFHGAFSFATSNFQARVDGFSSAAFAVSNGNKTCSNQVIAGPKKRICE